MPKKTKGPTKGELKKIAAEGAVVVDRSFLRDLANTIYNSRNRTYLRLCNGTLQNGPDPKDKTRPMHCGLGELYFQMTGYQPEETGVDEDDVVALATEQSTVKSKFEEDVADARVAVKALKLPKVLEMEKRNLLEQLDDAADWNEDDVQDDTCGEMAEDLVEFRNILNGIPTDNDQGPSDEVCSLTDYKERSVRVAKTLRQAAKLLPL
jgi:hypothetical protein